MRVDLREQRVAPRPGPRPEGRCRARNASRSDAGGHSASSDLSDVDADRPFVGMAFDKMRSASAKRLD
jgi:hypothetical protein